MIILSCDVKFARCSALALVLRVWIMDVIDEWYSSTKIGLYYTAHSIGNLEPWVYTITFKYTTLLYLRTVNVLVNPMINNIEQFWHFHSHGRMCNLILLYFCSLIEYCSTLNFLVWSIPLYSMLSTLFCIVIVESESNT